MMTGRELIKKLLECKDIDMDIMISVDISTSEHDADKRVFARESFGINSYTGDGHDIVLLFAGKLETKQ